MIDDDDKSKKALNRACLLRVVK